MAYSNHDKKIDAYEARRLSFAETTNRPTAEPHAAGSGEAADDDATTEPGLMPSATKPT